MRHTRKDFHDPKREKTEAEANGRTCKRYGDLLPSSGPRNFERGETPKRMKLYVYVLGMRKLSYDGMAEFVRKYPDRRNDHKREYPGVILRESAADSGHNEKHPLNAN